MNKIFTLSFFILFIILYPVFSTDPVNLIEEEYCGKYIGRHVEYINERELFKLISKKWNIDKTFTDKMISGELHSDKKFKMKIKHSSAGYTAYIFNRKENKYAVIEWGIDDLIKNENALEYSPVKKNISFLNFNPHAYWMKFKILNDSKEDIELFIEQDKQNFIWFDLFTKDKNQYILKKGAYEDSLPKREMKYKNIVFNIIVKPGLNTYYIRTDSYFFDIIPIRLWNKQGFIKNVAKDNAFQGIITGIFLLILFYCVFFLITEKNTSYIYLLLVVISSLILFLCTSGFGLQHLWMNKSTIGAFLFFITFPASFIVNLLFCASFIETKKNTPLIHKILITIIFFSGILLLLTLILPEHLRIRLFLIVILIEHIQFLPVIISSIIVIRKKYYTAIFLLIGIILHMLSQLEFLISSMNIIPYQYINYINIRGFSFILLMTFGLSYKIKKIKASLSNLQQKITDIRLKLKGKKIISDESVLKIETVKEYINKNYFESISRDSLSYAVGFSPDHFGRIFKQYTGEKISDYLNRMRIKQAVNILRKTDKKIIDIAYDVGFDSLRTFNKVFMDLMKKTPSHFRKKPVDSDIE